MIAIVKDKDGNIKTFSARADLDYNLVLGESIELSPLSFADYAARFKLSSAGKSGETLQVQQGAGTIPIVVTCADDTVQVDINGSIETLTPIGGVAALTLSAEVPGVFIIQPADRTKYCAAGEGMLVIEVNP